MVLLVLTVVSALIVVFTGGLARAAGSALGIGGFALKVWSIAKWPGLVVMVMAMVAILYWAAPNVKGRGFRWVTPGSVLALLLWMIASAGFAFYVAHFASYNKTYGAIGAVMVLLTWMYLTMLVILAGGELNAELHHGTGALRPRAGAVYEGRVVTSGAPSRASTDRPAPLRARGSEHDGGAARG